MRAPTAAEAYRLAADNRPICCGEPKQWRRAAHLPDGGFWVCAVSERQKKRERAARRRARNQQKGPSTK